LVFLHDVFINFDRPNKSLENKKFHWLIDRYLVSGVCLSFYFLFFFHITHKKHNNKIIRENERWSTGLGQLGQLLNNWPVSTPVSASMTAQRHLRRLRLLRQVHLPQQPPQMFQPYCRLHLNRLVNMQDLKECSHPKDLLVLQD